jgi:hypothetical protein
MILATSACSTPERRAPNGDTVALLRTVVKYASDTLRLGPRIIIARATKSNPNVKLSLATQNALVSSEPTLSAVERYDIAHQVCDTVAKAPSFCHFADADGMIGVRDVRLWRDSARVGIEYYRSAPAGGDAKARAKKKILVFDAGEASLQRDVTGQWKMRKFTETGGSTKP